MTKKQNVIIVNVNRLEDWYVATSKDLQGLHVAGPDLARVLKEIPLCIKALYKAKYDIEVKIEDGGSIDDREVFPLRYTATREAA